MTNPATAAILNNKRLEAIKEDNQPEDQSVLTWKHWKVSLPPERKTVVITDDKTIMVAMMMGSDKWSCGTKVFTFDQYPKWAEHPNFSKLGRKVSCAAKDVQPSPSSM